MIELAPSRDIVLGLLTARPAQISRGLVHFALHDEGWENDGDFARNAHRINTLLMERSRCCQLQLTQRNVASTAIALEHERYYDPATRTVKINPAKAVQPSASEVLQRVAGIRLRGCKHGTTLYVTPRHTLLYWNGDPNPYTLEGHGRQPGLRRSSPWSNLQTLLSDLGLGIISPELLIDGQKTPPPIKGEILVTLRAQGWAIYVGSVKLECIKGQWRIIPPSQT